MYRKKEKVAEFEKFDMVFGGNLRRANRWARLTDLIPWDEVEARYASLFVEQNSRPAISVRVALGSLILKENLQYCKARGIGWQALVGYRKESKAAARGAAHCASG